MRIEEALAVIDSQISQLRAVIRESKAALEALESLKEDPSLLVPLGGGVFVSAAFQGKTLIDVGGGIVVESTVEKIIERLKRRIERAEKEIERLNEEKKKIIEAAKKGGR